MAQPGGTGLSTFMQNAAYRQETCRGQLLSNGWWEAFDARRGVPWEGQWGDKAPQRGDTWLTTMAGLMTRASNNGWDEVEKKYDQNPDGKSSPYEQGDDVEKDLRNKAIQHVFEVCGVERDLDNMEAGRPVLCAALNYTWQQVKARKKRRYLCRKRKAQSEADSGQSREEEPSQLRGSKNRRRGNQSPASLTRPTASNFDLIVHQDQVSGGPRVMHDAGPHANMLDRSRHQTGSGVAVIATQSLEVPVKERQNKVRIQLHSWSKEMGEVIDVFNLATREHLRIEDLWLISQAIEGDECKKAILQRRPIPARKFPDLTQSHQLRLYCMAVNLDASCHGEVMGQQHLESLWTHACRTWNGFSGEAPTLQVLLFDESSREAVMARLQ